MNSTNFARRFRSRLARSLLKRCVYLALEESMTPFTRVADFMTAHPFAIGLEASLALAEKEMKHLRVRQLPVLHEGRLRGTVSLRDVALVRALELDPAEVSVAEAFAAEPYTVSADAPLGRVARAMATHRYSCAIVVEPSGAVRGILTASDALRALAQLLDRLEPGQTDLRPSQTRALILTEHAHLRELIHGAIEGARAVLADASTNEGIERMRESARAAFTALVAHTELEDHTLAPVLETIDAWGKVRANELRREHTVQRLALSRALSALAEEEPCAAVLAASIEDVLLDVLKDMEAEEREMLSEELMSDDISQPAANSG